MLQRGHFPPRAFPISRLGTPEDCPILTGSVTAAAHHPGILMTMTCQEFFPRGKEIFTKGKEFITPVSPLRQMRALGQCFGT